MGLFDKLNRNPDKNINNVKSSQSDNSKGFRYLDKLIHSGAKEIHLDCDIEVKSEFLNDEEKKYRDGIILDVDNLVIDGNGHTIDAKGKLRIFHCTGKNITIQNVTLKNGFAKPDFGNNVVGGAILNSGSSLNIHDSVLSNNVADRGGAIFGGGLNIVNSVFNYNTAVDGSGGAIDCGGILNIKDSTFSNNSANYEGGAINLTNCDFNIQGCEFYDNAAEEGGAISDRGPNAYAPTFTIYNNEFDIKESIFKNNSAKRRGSAIISRNMLNIYDSKIVDNTCDDEGIIYSWGNVKIFNCKIFNNESKDDIIYNEDSLQIYGSEFKDNQSRNIISNSSNAYITYCQFKENDIEESVIYNYGEYCTIEKCTFETLSKEEVHNIINNGNLTLTSPKIKDESETILNSSYMLAKDVSSNFLSKICGDGVVERADAIIPKMKKFDFGYLDRIIHNSTSNEIVLKENICLEKYETDFYEGGIELDIDDLIIDGNGKTIDGANKSRIFIVTGKNVTLKNITFKNGCSFHNYENPLNNHGGALRINQEANLTIKGCKFVGNESEENGSAIYNRGELNISKSKITKHESKNKGGAIYNVHGLLNITKSILSHNTAQRGGAIHNEYATLNMSKSALLNNIASQPGTVGTYGSGGALNNERGNMAVSESLFSGNSATFGGAITNDEGDLTLTKSTFVENVTDTKFDGGVVYSCEKGKDKVFEFISNEMGPRHISIEKCFNIDELKDNPIKYVNIKECTFKGNKPHDFSSETIDSESEWLKNYDLNDILGFNYH